MIKKIPKKQQEVEEEVGEKTKKLLFQICNQKNIRYKFLKDSKIIQSSIHNIAKRLGKIKVTTKGRMTEEEFEKFKKQVKMIEDTERKEGDEENI